MIHPLKLNTKNETLKMQFKAGDLINVDIRFKFASLQCSWIKNLNDDCSHVQDFTVQNLCLILLLVFLHISYIRAIFQAGQTTIVYCMYVLVVFSYYKYSIITMLNKIQNIVLKYQSCSANQNRLWIKHFVITLYTIISWYVNDINALKQSPGGVL